jgi:hypothetical protein
MKIPEGGDPTVERDFEKLIMAEARPFSDYLSHALTSKMWILPDGIAVSTRTLHFRWLQMNPVRVLTWGLDVASLPDNEQLVRMAAVKRGFFRVNFEHRSGLLVCEGLKSHFSPLIRWVLLQIVRLNQEAVMRLRLTLFDDEVSLVTSITVMSSPSQIERALSSLDPL